MEYQKDLESMMDDLLSGRLSPTEEAQLMQQISQNPDLQADFQHQNDVVGALRDVRKAELKARLDAIVIEPTLIGALTYSMFSKIAASLVVATSVSIGAYYYFNTPAEPKTFEVISSKPAPLDLNSAELPSLPEQLDKFEIEKIDDKTLTASATNKIVVPKNNPIAKEESLQPTVTQPVIADAFEDELPKSPILEAIPTISKSKTIESPTEIENIEDGAYKFHYRYFDNKLYLYGDFKGIPYQILEIHGANGRSTYLSYKGQYYTLKASIKDIVPLEPLTDQELINELEMLKREKSF